MESAIAAENSGGTRVGFLGPPGTFSEEALLASASSTAVEPVAFGTIYDALASIARGELDWGVVPIENSLEGSVSVTLDLLAEESEHLEIVAEVLVTVRHSLVAAEPIALEEIVTVLTHPQVPGQCRRFLRSELPQARVLSSSSTAEAVRAAAAGAEPGLAAIGTLLAAEIYGGTVLRQDIQDRDDNETRFLWIGGRERSEATPPLGLRRATASKTSLVFWGAGAEGPGWLVGCLDVFASRAINLTRIESRPRRERLGNYMFFIDLEGDLAEAPVTEALGELRAICEDVLVLGSYPRA